MMVAARRGSLSSDNSYWLNNIAMTDIYSFSFPLLLALGMNGYAVHTGTLYIMKVNLLCIYSMSEYLHSDWDYYLLYIGILKCCIIEYKFGM